MDNYFVISGTISSISLLDNQYIVGLRLEHFKNKPILNLVLTKEKAKEFTLGENIIIQGEFVNGPQNLAIMNAKYIQHNKKDK